MVYYTRTVRPQRRQEINSGECLVEKGYIPPKMQIERMMAAGERLAAARAEMYDAVDLRVEPDLDPTRRPGYDMADASRDARALQGRMAQRANQERRKEGVEKKVIRSRKKTPAELDAEEQAELPLEEASIEEDEVLPNGKDERHVKTRQGPRRSRGDNPQK